MNIQKQEKPIEIWWIDDDHDIPNGRRQKELAALRSEVRGSLDLIPIHPAEFEDNVESLENEFTPDLLLIDFRLDTQKHPSKKKTPYFALDGVSLRGTTLRDRRLKNIPAYLVSKVIKRNQIGSSDDYFDWVLSHDQLVDGGGGSFLMKDASDYRQLRERNREASAFSEPKEIQARLVEAIRDLLCVPRASLPAIADLAYSLVTLLLQEEEKLDVGEVKLTPSRTRSIARWIRTKLHRLRGPLIDEIAVATHLGMKLDYFRDKIEPRLDTNGVKYTGVFQSTASMTYWRQEFLQWILSQHQSIQYSSLAVLSQSSAEHFKVPAKERSTCRVCNKFWPEAIAIDEDDSTVEEPVHWRCSYEATDIASFPGFDVPRRFSE